MLTWYAVFMAKIWSRSLALALGLPAHADLVYGIQGTDLEPQSSYGSRTYSPC